jgi:hypothetical protein
MGQPRNELDRPKTTIKGHKKKDKRHFENIRHFGKLSSALFYILGLCTKDLFYFFLKKDWEEN